MGFTTFVAGTAAVAAEVNANFLLMPPIGSIISWLKDFTNTPALPDGWLECNGQTVDDAESVYDGQDLPDLNGDTGAKRFLRGSTSSGDTGGTETHNHGGATGAPTTATIGNPSNAPNYPAQYHTHSITSNGTLPSYYEVVFIMRIK